MDDKRREQIAALLEAPLHHVAEAWQEAEKEADAARREWERRKNAAALAREVLERRLWVDHKNETVIIDGFAHRIEANGKLQRQPAIKPGSGPASSKLTPEDFEDIPF